MLKTVITNSHRLKLTTNIRHYKVYIKMSNTQNHDYFISPHNEHRPKISKTLFGPVNFQLFKNYIKINSRIRFGPVNTNIHFDDCFIFKKESKKTLKIAIDHYYTHNEYFILIFFLYLLAVYVLQLTKTVVPSKIFAILCLNMFMISMKKYFV